MSTHIETPGRDPDSAGRRLARGGQDGVRAGLAGLLPRLRRFALALTGSAPDADDLVQATMERALSREAKWRTETRLDSWLYRIMQNLWIDQGRRARRSAAAILIEQTPALRGEDGRETVDRRARLAAARDAFAALDADLRATAGLVILNGLSYREAAAALNIPIGTVMSRVSRSRQALRRRWTEPRPLSPLPSID